MIARPLVWVAELASRFWAAIGKPPPFPRDLRATIPHLPNLRVREVPQLTLQRAAEHYQRWRIPFSIPQTQADRPRRGCFGGHGEAALILIDSTDPEDEKRFTLAHELAHYLRDFAEPRRKAVARLGPAVLEVLDGLRPPTVAERLAGVLRGVTVGCHTHLLERDRWGRAVSSAAREAEEAADRLAYELLAPFDALEHLRPANGASLVETLVSVFGLPSIPAANYAAILRPDHFSRKCFSAFPKT